MEIIRETVKSFDWAELKAAVGVGTIESRDLIRFTLKNGEEVAARATHDGKENLFFVLEDCLNDTHVMNRRMTNKGGWAECEMRKHLNTTIFALLPDELQALIKPTKIVQILDGERVECEDKLFLLSKTQVFGEGSYSEYEPEDSHFDIFRREKDRVKEYGNSGTCHWWLRSPLASASTNFCAVYSNGSSYNYNAIGSIGVAFGFLLRREI